MPDDDGGDVHQQESDADRAITELYGKHYESLLGIAVLLNPDAETAENTVRDSFVAMHSAWRRLRSGERALVFLYSEVVRRSRQARQREDARAQRRRTAGLRRAARMDPQQALASQDERLALLPAVRGLAPAQREVLVLRYYADLPDAQIASAMRISAASVARIAAQAMSALRADLEPGAARRSTSARPKGNGEATSRARSWHRSQGRP